MSDNEKYVRPYLVMINRNAGPGTRAFYTLKVHASSHRTATRRGLKYAKTLFPNATHEATRKHIRPDQLWDEELYITCPACVGGKCVRGFKCVESCSLKGKET